MSAQAVRGGEPLIHDDELFERMTLGERLQHGVLVVSFSTLVITGLPIFLYQLPVFSRQEQILGRRACFCPVPAYPELRRKHLPRFDRHNPCAIQFLRFPRQRSIPVYWR